MNHENATRCFELSMDETEEQTRRIHERQRLLRTEAGLALRQEAEATSRRHWNAQRLLEPLPVVIPCHRVVRSDGAAGQYVGGAAAKAALLRLESA